MHQIGKIYFRMRKAAVTYYKLPLESIPFSEITSLEDFNYQYVYCSSFSLKDYMELDYHLLSVYDTFDDEITDVNELKIKELLFGQVVSDRLSTRGKAKCLKIASLEESISKEELPHLKYNSGDNSKDGKWFYMKDGNYVIFSGIPIQFEKVKHLEGIAIYGDNIVRLRIVMELLKINVKEGLLKLSEEEYKEIAYKVLRTDPTLLRTEESIIRDGVNNWVPPMLLTPLYSDIANVNKGRVNS